MGVTQLTQYMMRSVPRGYEQIDILLEIAKFKSESDNMRPAIIFDVMGFIHSFGQTNDECVLGGRHNLYIELATNFFYTLRECGAELVFCCDGQLQQSRIDVWSGRKDREYKETLATLSLIDARRYRCSDKNWYRGSKYFVNSLMETAKRFGTVIIATDRDCDSIAAQYATANNALAIVASDSDYLIYEGNWQHWHVNSIDMVRFSVKCFNRDALIEDLRLTRDQMKAFATIAGNDYTDCMRSEKREMNFWAIADFCRTLASTQNDFVHRKISEFILEGKQLRSDSVEIIKKSIDSYDIDFEPVVNVDKLELYASENVLMHAILNDGIFQYQVNYVDFNQANNNNNCCNDTFLERILRTMRRLAGILLHGKESDRQHFRLLTKHSLETKYELTHEVPEYPELEMPILNDLIFGECDLDDTRWKLMMWCLDCKEQFYGDLKKIPDRLKLTVMAIVFLYESREISLKHADALLVTEYTLSDVGPKDFPQTSKIEFATRPRNMFGNIVRAAQKYNRTMLLMWDCFIICGLQRFIAMSYFDGFLFHNLCLSFDKSATEYAQNVKTIENFRLYVRPTLYRKE